ncbi:hypothetical protein [Streptomyces lavendulae]|uniref:hypothetical protein n=1 Tax=Streptomyces lavendulae TaxID=1914 RepID=UPI0024A0052B|nr:hypothetical protein [Streptomyces lavendulae]GLX21517.1 hypothetical protein Slala01_51610 [Streptomyces lavendulae subsp. lavendulae]GLX28934.1 hypothetical protein Slala02_47540 [Streptomyces lavendulae subsp. lavendulae]
MTALVKLYPARFRREFGDEIALAYHEATRGAGRRARIREGLDVTGHALRMRLGLGSAGRRGRLVAAVAPFAAATVGGSAVWWAGLMLPGATASWPPAEVAIPYVLLMATHLVTVLGAAIALSGRWSAGGWTAVAGCAATAVIEAMRMGGGVELVLFFRTPLLLAALAVVLCPADLRPQPRVRTTAGLAAVMVWTALLAGVLTVGPLPDGSFGGLRFAVPAAAGLALAGRPAFAGLRTAPAVLLAALPLLVLGAPFWTRDPYTGPLALVLLLVAAAAVSIRRRRGRRPLDGV